MFHYANGLRLTSIDLAIDVRRRQPRGFVSHAHMDHLAPHELTFCTPASARLIGHRIGKRLIHEMPYDMPLEWDGAAWQPAMTRQDMIVRALLDADSVKGLRSHDTPADTAAPAPQESTR